MKISIKIDDRKLEAIRCYISDTDSLEKQITAAANAAAMKELERQYAKNVPKAVREFIERTSSDKKVNEVHMLETD